MALCVPEEACAMNQRTVLSEIGSDHDALREQDRAAILFDLGLGALQIDACIRSSDFSRRRRAAASGGTIVVRPRQRCNGRSWPPTRAGFSLASRAGRVEVFQLYPSSPSHAGTVSTVRTRTFSRGYYATNVKTPRRHRRKLCRPDGFLALASTRGIRCGDAFGHRRSFQSERHAAFQMNPRAALRWPTRNSSRSNGELSRRWSRGSGRPGRDSRRPLRARCRPRCTTTVGRRPSRAHRRWRPGSRLTTGSILTNWTISSGDHPGWLDPWLQRPLVIKFNKRRSTMVLNSCALPPPQRPGSLRLTEVRSAVLSGPALTAACALASFAFACATPFAAFAVVAGGRAAAAGVFGGRRCVDRQSSD